MVKINMIPQKVGFANCNETSFSVMVLKAGKTNSTIIKANAKAINEITKDSLKNCPINSPRPEPMALRTPTSFALFSERAVLKFMKLMQAINKTMSPKMPKSFTYLIKPPVFMPSENSL